MSDYSHPPFFFFFFFSLLLSFYNVTSSYYLFPPFSPYPVFAIGVGASLLILGLVFVNARGLTNPHIFLNIGLPLGGIAVMTASMFSFAEGNTFLVSQRSPVDGSKRYILIYE